MTKKILIVEDTPDLLESITELLILEGFEVIACLNGISAMEKLTENLPDLIITDLSMPDMDGFELIEKIREKDALKKIPIAIFSARLQHENQSRAVSLGVTSYIKKPCSPEELLVTVDALIKENNGTK